MNGLGFERYAANVRSGEDFERYVAFVLRSVGLTVYRSSASRGCADLVVSNDERQYLTVQCKKHGRVRYVRDVGLQTTTASARASAPSVGSPSSECEDEEA